MEGVDKHMVKCQKTITARKVQEEMWKMKNEACELCSSEAAAREAAVALDVMAEESDSSTPLPDTTDSGSRCSNITMTPV